MQLLFLTTLLLPLVAFAQSTSSTTVATESDASITRSVNTETVGPTTVGSITGDLTTATTGTDHTANTIIGQPSTTASIATPGPGTDTRSANTEVQPPTTESHGSTATPASAWGLPTAKVGGEQKWVGLGMGIAGAVVLV